MEVTRLDPGIVRRTVVRTGPGETRPADTSVCRGIFPLAPVRDLASEAMPDICRDDPGMGDVCPDLGGLDGAITGLDFEGRCESVTPPRGRRVGFDGIREALAA